MQQQDLKGMNGNTEYHVLNSGETVHYNLVDPAAFFQVFFDIIKIEKPITVNVHKVYICSVTVHQHKTEDYAAATTDCCVTMN